MVLFAGKQSIGSTIILADSTAEIAPVAAAEVIKFIIMANNSSCDCHAAAKLSRLLRGTLITSFQLYIGA